jgi:hypothetical protein
MQLKNKTNIKIFLPLLLLTCMVFPLLTYGCNGSSTDLKKTDVIEPDEATKIVENVDESTGIITSEDKIIQSSDVSFVKEVLTLSNAPAVNQSVNLTYTLEVLDSNYKQFTKIWIEFEHYDPSLYYPLGRGYERDEMIKLMNSPQTKSNYYYDQLQLRKDNQPESIVTPESVIVDGETEWAGVTLQKDKILVLSSRISFPETGEWLITVKSVGNDGQIQERISLKVTVNEDYGMKGWLRNYEPAEAESTTRLDDEHAFCIEPTIDKAPAVNQPATLSYTLLSSKVVKDLKVKVVFAHWETGSKGEQVPSDEIMNSNNSVWVGNLEPFSPISNSVTVMFPEIGDWEILVYGTCPNYSFDYPASVFLHVGKEEGRVGWLESHDPEQ